MDIKLETQKLQLESAVKTTELRKQENDLYERIIALSKEYSDRTYRYAKARNPSEMAALSNEIRELSLRLATVKDDFIAIESKLTRLEGREPRKIDLWFIVPAPPQRVAVSVR